MRAKFRTLAPSILCAARLTTTLPVVGRNAGKALQGRGLLQTRESTSLVQRALLAGGGGPEIHCPEIPEAISRGGPRRCRAAYHAGLSALAATDQLEPRWQ